MTTAPPDQPVNLLGAIALAVGDRMSATVLEQTGHGPTSAAALSAIDQFLGEPSIEFLAQVVGLSHSGAVRLVDRLERDGLVLRRPGADARSISVRATPAGRRVARRVEATRLETLRACLEPLSPDERATFARVAGRILAGMVRAPGATRWICRMCDLAACGRPAGQCPVEQQASAGS